MKHEFVKHAEGDNQRLGLTRENRYQRGQASQRREKKHPVDPFLRYLRPLHRRERSLSLFGVIAAKRSHELRASRFAVCVGPLRVRQDQGGISRMSNEAVNGGDARSKDAAELFTLASGGETSMEGKEENNRRASTRETIRIPSGAWNTSLLRNI